MLDFEIEVMDQFVREEGSHEEVKSWSDIKFRLKELEAVQNRVCECGKSVYTIVARNITKDYGACYCPCCGGKIEIKSEVKE